MSCLSRHGANPTSTGQLTYISRGGALVSGGVVSLDEALHLNIPEMQSCLPCSQGLCEAPSHFLTGGFKMSSGMLGAYEMNALRVFLSREDQCFTGRKKACFWTTRP